MSGGNADHDTAGSIRSAGGGFAKMEIAHEEEYFYKLVNSGWTLNLLLSKILILSYLLLASGATPQIEGTRR